MGVYLSVLERGKTLAGFEAPLVACGALVLGIFLTRPVAVPHGVLAGILPHLCATIFHWVSFCSDFFLLI